MPEAPWGGPQAYGPQGGGVTGRRFSPLDTDELRVDALVRPGRPIVLTVGDGKMIRYRCTRCGAVLENPSSLAGRHERCLRCGTMCRVPTRHTLLLIALAIMYAGLIIGTSVALQLLAQRPEKTSHSEPAARTSYPPQRTRDVDPPEDEVFTAPEDEIFNVSIDRQHALAIYRFLQPHSSGRFDLVLPAEVPLTARIHARLGRIVTQQQIIGEFGNPERIQYDARKKFMGSNRSVTVRGTLLTYGPLSLMAVNNVIQYAWMEGWDEKDDSREQDAAPPASQPDPD